MRDDTNSERERDAILLRSPELLSKAIWALILLMILAALLLFAVPASAGDANVSRPCGFVRLVLGDTNGANTVGMPFRAFDTNASADSVLQGNFNGGTNGADRIFKWNPQTMTYDKVTRVGSSWIPSNSLTLDLGEGVWLYNKESNNVVVAGRIPLDATNQTVLVPGVNVISLPFASGVSRSQTAFSNIAGQAWQLMEPGTLATPDDMRLGSAYWLVNNSGAPLVWTEVRPYDNPFPDEGLPAITGISVVDDGKAVLVGIAVSGAKGETIDVLVKDVTPTGAVELSCGWILAAADISVEGKTALEWKDEGSSDRKPVNEVFGRFYTVGTGFDGNGNGIPDARELLTRPAGSPPIRSGTTGGSDGVSSIAPVSTPADGDMASTNKPSLLPTLRLAGRVIYVDKMIGSDSYTALSPVVVGGHGPAKTIKRGLELAGKDDLMVVKTGVYGEPMDLGGRQVQARIEGKVFLAPQRKTPSAGWTNKVSAAADR